MNAQVKRLGGRLAALGVFLLLGIALVVVQGTTAHACAAELAPGAELPRVQSGAPVFLEVFVDGSVAERAVEEELEGGDDTVAFVYDVVAGTAVYEKSTKTLTINGLHASGIDVHRSIALNLVGENVLEGSGGGFIDCASNLRIDLSIYGEGSLAISTASDSTPAIRLGGNRKGAELEIKGGSLTIDASGKAQAIDIEYGDMSMTGGCLDVKSGDIVLKCFYKNGKASKFGTVSITGGEFSSASSIKTDGHMNCKASCLKSVRGELPIGATFVAGGNEYKCCAYAEGNASEVRYVKLAKYKAKSATPTFGKRVRFGGASYKVLGVAKKAFNTSRGGKVRKAVFKGRLKFIDAKAFQGAKSLKYLALALPVSTKSQADAGASLAANPTETQFKWQTRGAKVAKTAFAKCGKNAGKSLRVRVLKYQGSKADAKKALVQKGLSKRARVV